MLDDFPAENDELELCCGRRHCPVIRRNGGNFVLSEHGVAIEFDQKQAAALAQWLLARLEPAQQPQDLHSEL